MKTVHFIFLLVVFTGITSCKQDAANTAIVDDAPWNNIPIILNPPEYVCWCQDSENDLKKTKHIEDITYFLFYKPAEYVIAEEQKTKTISTKIYSKKIAELEGLDYYDFKIQLTSDEGELLKHQLGTTAEYEQRLNYFAFDMQRDIKIIEGIDTLDCALFHFERAYDVAPYAVFVLGFPKSGKDITDRTIFYQDNVFHKGIIKFTYTKEELTRIPKLKTI